jgi:hypothetical protein
MPDNFFKWFENQKEDKINSKYNKNTSGKNCLINPLRFKIKTQKERKYNSEKRQGHIHANYTPSRHIAYLK